MAHLATTRAGVAEFLAGGAKGHLWIGNNVLSDEEVRILRQQGSSITVFTSQVKTLAEIEGAVPILREHHPNEAIWIEQLPEGANPKSSDVAQAFLWKEPIIGVEFTHDAFVRIMGGEESGQTGSLVTIVTLTPEPIYLVELESGGDVQVKQSLLQIADA